MNKMTTTERNVNVMLVIDQIPIAGFTLRPMKMYFSPE